MTQQNLSARPRKRYYSLKLYAIILVSTFTIIMIILFSGEYSKKEQVTGEISMPDMVYVHGNRSGYVQRVYVKKGDSVKRNEPLFDIGLTQQDRIDAESNQRSNLNTLIELEQLSDQTAEDITGISGQRETIEEYFQNTLQAYNESSEAIGDSIQLLSQRLDIASSRLQDMETLVDRGIRPREDLETAQAQVIDARLEMADLRRSSARIEQDKRELRSNVSSQNLDLTRQSLSLREKQSSLRSRILDLKKEDYYTVLAPEPGIVTDLLVEHGDAYETSTPLSVVKTNTQREYQDALRVNLAVPADKIGLVDIERDIVLRVDTFPYEHYGVLRGRVRNVSNVPVNGANEEFYPVSVNLINQGQQSKIPNEVLLDGMTVTAYLAQPPQTLFSWLFMPIKKAFTRNPDFFNSGN